MPTQRREPVPINIEKRIGATVYRVTGTFSTTAKETADQKMRRLILRDAEKLDGGAHRRL